MQMIRMRSYNVLHRLENVIFVLISHRSAWNSDVIDSHNDLNVETVQRSKHWVLTAAERLHTSTMPFFQTVKGELAHIDIKNVEEIEEKSHNLDFWVHNGALLIDLAESVDRCEIDEADVPMRAISWFQSKQIYMLHLAALMPHGSS